MEEFLILTSSFYEQNRSLLLSKLKKQSIVILFSNNKNFKLDSAADFESEKNFYYLTGISENNAALLMIKDVQERTKSFLFLKKINSVEQKYNGISLTLEEASKLSCIPLENCLDINCFNSFLSNLMNNFKRDNIDFIKNIYLDFLIPHLNPNNLSLIKARWINDNYPYINIKNISSFLSQMRTIKKEEEIIFIKKAIHINEIALREIVKILKPGIYEYQITSFYNYFLSNRCISPSFKTIVASGKNAVILHYNKQKDVIKYDDVVLLDLGVRYNNYSSDISRCFPVSGKFNSFQKIIYNLVLEANKKIIDWIKPGCTFDEINSYGKNLLKDGLIKNNLLKENESIEKYFYHGISHYLGLEVHDTGSISEPILENSVITVEPGLYFEEFNLGIRIEDDILIKNNQNIILSKDIPKEIKDIENLMKV
ncbi:MAG: Xaa-Pro aminopeptidase [Candidatus Phytoplasma stylosanthis]|nr:Xaa-Pro aminopeptidase [Candidatus Phytoplasma stylosanthis]